MYAIAKRVANKRKSFIFFLVEVLKQHIGIEMDDYNHKRIS